MGFDSKRGNTTGFAFFVSDADGIRHKIWIRHEIWQHNRLWFLCRMLTGSDTKLGNTIGFVFFVSDVDGIRHKIWQHNRLCFFLCRMLMGSDTKFRNALAVDNLCVRSWCDPTQNLKTKLVWVLASDAIVIWHDIWKHKASLSHHFLLAEIIIQQKSSFHATFCIESIKKSKKIGCGMDT